MALALGRRLGRYRIEAPIGAGGMGEVFLALDTDLGRPAAIKVLPETLAADAERLDWLRREARALAALNHPNIATIYGFEESGGVSFLAMEFVDGQSLADLIAARAARHPGPVSISSGAAREPDTAARRRRQGDLRREVIEALAIGEQMADALAAAHDKGIIHRDLKPSNVMRDKSGQIKILDFGLAQRMPIVADTELSTMRQTLEATEHGSQIGTLPYMSPEQARGEPLDGRTDLWAFGCILYELLTATPAFRRATPADTIAALLGETPDLDRLPPVTPLRARWLIERCLRRDLRQRLHHAADARIEIAEARSELAADATGSVSATRPTGPSALSRPYLSRAALLGGAALVAAAIAVVLWTTRIEPRESPGTRTVRFDVPLPAGSSIFPGEVASYLAVSPDGEHLVFAGAGTRAPLYQHTFRTGMTQPLTGTEGAATPVWSPDGRVVAFFAEGRLKTIDLARAAPPQVVSDANWEAGLSWSHDGVLLFAQPTRDGIAIHRVSAEGGASSQVTHVDTTREIAHFWPHFLPDGRRFLYLAIEKSSGELPARTLYLASLDGEERQAIAGVLSRALYAAGRLFYVADGALVARAFDPDRAMFTGAPTAVTDRLRSFRMTGHAEFAVSQAAPSPVIAFHGGAWTNELVTYDRGGTRTGSIGDPGAFDQLHLSHDGKLLAAAMLDPSNGGRDLWIYELATNRGRRLTLHPPDEQSPVWSPDGRRLAFRSDVNGPPDLFARDASGGGTTEVLLSRPTVLNPEDWSRDGRYLLYRVVARATGNDLWLLSLNGTPPPRPLLNTRYSEWGGRFSPDSRWVAFTSDESGASEIYVAPLDDPGARRVLSNSGGISPRWRGDGRELFYLAPPGTMMAVSVQFSPALAIGEPRALFTLDVPVYAGSYEVSPDGQLFVVNQVIDDVRRSPIRVVLDWTPDD